MTFMWSSTSSNKDSPHRSLRAGRGKANRRPLQTKTNIRFER